MTERLQTLFEKLARALAKRAAWPENDTDALRMVDGFGDGFDDLEIDDFAGRWLVQTRSSEFPDWLREAKKPRSLYWKKLGETAAPVWQAGEKLAEPFLIRENGLSYRLDFSSGSMPGIFLDQRQNRRDLRAKARGRTVLNCFAYTCAFGVSAAADGARTINLDLSQHYLEWGRANYALNNLDPTAHEFIYGDVANWLERFARKKRAFDIIVLDPPTFSRDQNGRVFRLEKDFGDLVRAAEKILTPDGTLFCSTNLRSLTLAAFRRLLSSGLEKPAEWKFTPAPMPPDFSGEPYLKSCWLQRRAVKDR